MVNVEEIPTNAQNVSEIFEKAEKSGINIDMISQNDVSSHHGSFAFTCPKTDMAALEKIGKENEEKYEKTPFNTLVSLVDALTGGVSRENAP